ncbi:MAG: translesion error-prone DNA polymerase V autoproteolytic subunit [Spirochaetaceae bacterium]|nr:translesion error-prone DNA polymerase V autoproteolytic subunit [Spirochaetaceae bacterium]
MYSLPAPVTPGTPRSVPLFSQSVRAGFPSPAADYVESSLDFNKLLINDTATTFVVRAAGESMRGAGIFPGDLLVVDRSLVARKEDIVIAALDGEFTVKRLKSRNGHFILAPENPAYPVIKLDEASELSIWGVVTYVLHGLRAAERRR